MTLNEKHRGFVWMKLDQLQCQHGRQRCHQHCPLHLGRETIAHHALCHVVYHSATRAAGAHPCD